MIKIKTYCLDNFVAREISVETDISRGLYHFSIIGMGDKAIDESRGRILSAIKNSNLGIKSVNQKITVLLAPASIKKEGSGFDLPIAVSYLSAIGRINFDAKRYIFIGELSLNGELRAPKNFLHLFREILKKEKGSVIVTSIECENLCKYFIDKGIVYCKNLREVLELGEESRGESEVLYEEFVRGKARKVETFNLITGCESAKRAVAIAVAGRHNLLMVGPPGTGKTLLAKSIVEITPTLSKEESFECTALQQLNTDVTEPIIFPPFREPHHTSSYSAIIGDAQLNAGEITKAHHGFLFLDEIPEFESRVIDSLREPLESGKLVLSKRKGSVNLPANFTLIATMNPCKCGFRGSSYKKCICRNVDAIKYANKISGPILDRFDMVMHVDVVGEDGGKEENLHEKIKNAIVFSHKRYPLFNGKLKITHPIKLIESTKNSLDEITKGLNLSKRSIIKITKVARTIADLEQSEEILPEHLYEAVGYRQGIV